MKEYQVIIDSPLGPILLRATDLGLCKLGFVPGESLDAKKISHPLLLQTKRELAEYFAHRRKDFSIPLDISIGTPFQKGVWESLKKIPYGKTQSYKEQTEGLFGSSRAVRAVAQANGRNPVAIVLPCHRVIASNGALQGYAGGLEIKQWLLDWERGF